MQTSFLQWVPQKLRYPAEPILLSCRLLRSSTGAKRDKYNFSDRYLNNPPIEKVIFSDLLLISPRLFMISEFMQIRLGHTYISTVIRKDAKRMRLFSLMTGHGL